MSQVEIETREKNHETQQACLRVQCQFSQHWLQQGVSNFKTQIWNLGSRCPFQNVPNQTVDPLHRSLHCPHQSESRKPFTQSIAHVWCQLKNFVPCCKELNGRSKGRVVLGTTKFRRQKTLGLDMFVARAARIKKFDALNCCLRHDPWR